MPMKTKCFVCGFSGNHGFTTSVMGLLHIYHGNGCGGYWRHKGKDYATKSDAWHDMRKQHIDDDWRKAWDAMIFEQNERKYNKLMKSWREKQYRLDDMAAELRRNNMLITKG